MSKIIIRPSADAPYCIKFRKKKKRNGMIEQIYEIRYVPTDLITDYKAEDDIFTV